MVITSDELQSCYAGLHSTARTWGVMRAAGPSVSAGLVVSTLAMPARDGNSAFEALWLVETSVGLPCRLFLCISCSGAGLFARKSL